MRALRVGLNNQLIFVIKIIYTQERQSDQQPRKPEEIFGLIKQEVWADKNGAAHGNISHRTTGLKGYRYYPEKGNCVAGAVSSKRRMWIFNR